MGDPSGGRPPVLIMGLGHPRQGACVKSLSLAGMAVHAVHTENKAYRYSRHLTSFHRIETDPSEQLAHLERFGRENGGVLLPTNDDYVALVSRNRERLARYFTITLPGWDIVGPMLDRESAYAKAQSLGIQVPRHWCPANEAETQAAIAALDVVKCDYILKTRSVLSVPADPVTVRQTKVAPRRREDILSAISEIHARTGAYPIIQQVVPGAAERSVGASLVIAPNGEVVLAYCVRRLRLATYTMTQGYVHPYELGSVVWCETTHDAQALEAARTLMKAFGYTGVATVEFRRDERSGDLYLTKLELRPVRATSLSRAIGMDIPTTLVAAFTGGTPRVAADYPDGVRWLWFQGYANSLIRNPHHNRRDMLRALRHAHRIKALAEDLADPLPLAAGIARLSVRAVTRPFRRSARRNLKLQPSAT